MLITCVWCERQDDITRNEALEKPLRPWRAQARVRGWEAKLVGTDEIWTCQDCVEKLAKA